MQQNVGAEGWEEGGSGGREKLPAPGGSGEYARGDRERNNALLERGAGILLVEELGDGGGLDHDQAIGLVPGCEHCRV